MKVFAVLFLILGIFCSSTAAIAEGPIPFNALMQTVGAQAAVPPMPVAKDSTGATLQAAPREHMTSGGKAMMGAGIGLVAIGAIVVFVDAAFGATFGTKGTGGRSAAGYVGGFGAIAGGTTLIVFGSKRRTDK